MKYQLSVCMKNNHYARALAKGIAFQGEGITVKIIEDKDELSNMQPEGVLITDINMPYDSHILLLKDEKDNVDSIYPKSQIAHKTLSMKHLLEKASQMYFDNTGELLLRSHVDTRVIELFSEKGGTGVSTIAIALSRILSEGYGRKVCYLNLSPIDDYKWIFRDDENINEKVASKSEYVYMKEKNIPVLEERYFLLDEKAVHYFKPDLRKNSFCFDLSDKDIISTVADSNYFSHLIVDRGKCLPEIVKDGNLKRIIIEVTGKYYPEKSWDELAENEFRIKNFCTEKSIWQSISRKFRIPWDKELLSVVSGISEITEDSLFFSAINDIAETIISFTEQNSISISSYVELCRAKTVAF